MKLVAVQGTRQLLVEDNWRGSHLALGVIVDGNEAWEVPIGSALGRGYWEEVDDRFVDRPSDVVPWDVRSR